MIKEEVHVDLDLRFISLNDLWELYWCLKKMYNYTQAQRVRDFIELYHK